MIEITEDGELLVDACDDEEEMSDPGLLQNHQLQPQEDQVESPVNEEEVEPIDLQGIEDFFKMCWETSEAEKSEEQEQAGEEKFEEMMVNYFAGYIGFTASKRLKCEACKAAMTKESKEELQDKEFYTVQREYADQAKGASDVNKVLRLHRPTDIFNDAVDGQLEIFAANQKRLFHDYNVIKELVEIAVRTPSLSTWLDESHPCYAHRVEALTFFYVVKAYSQTTRINNMITKAKRTKSGQPTEPRDDDEPMTSTAEGEAVQAESTPMSSTAEGRAAEQGTQAAKKSSRKRKRQPREEAVQAESAPKILKLADFGKQKLDKRKLKKLMHQ